VTRALNAGMHMALIPISADQRYKAACCAALGTGQVVAPE
jgi:hypothetical protein